MPLAKPPAPRKNGGAPPDETELARVLERASRATVRIEGLEATGTTRSGSGIVVSQDGGIMTTNWVVDPTLTDLVVVLPSGERVPLASIDRDPVRHIARARLGRQVDDWIDATASARREGWVVCAGSLTANPTDRQPARTTGTILETSYNYQRASSDKRPRGPNALPGALKIDCPVRMGMEGGPVLDTAGGLVGVIVDHGVAAPVAPVDGAATADGTAAPAVDRWGQLERTVSPGEAWKDAEVLVERGDAGARGLVVGRSRAVLTLARVVDDGTKPVIARVPSEVSRAAGKYLCAPLAVRGELALLHCGDLDGATPILATLSPSLAQEVWSHQGPQHWLGGFITGIDREPGLVTLEPQGRYRWGICGTAAVKYEAANPPVTLGKVFAFDGASTPGALVVGAQGVPLGIAIAEVGTGVSYAVPLADAFERFPEID